MAPAVLESFLREGTWLSSIVLSVGTEDLQVVSVATGLQDVAPGMNGKLVQMKYGSLVTYNVSASSSLLVHIEEKTSTSQVDVACTNLEMSVSVVPPPSAWGVGADEPTMQQFGHVNMQIHRLSTAAAELLEGILGDSGNADEEVYEAWHYVDEHLLQLVP